MVTPLTEAGELNHEAMEQLVELFVSQRLGGVFILGSTGQWPLLDPSERRAVTDRVVRTANGRLPVMVHVGALGTDAAVALARHAAKAGADAVSCVAPIYYPLETDVIFEHYRRVAIATHLPFYVYHLATVNQLALDPSEYAERLLALPNIAGMKITEVDLNLLGLLYYHTHGRLSLFSGADEIFCHAVLSGATGAVGTLFNLWGPKCAVARKACVAGYPDVGRRFMLEFQRVVSVVCRPRRLWSFLRAAMRLKYQIEIGLPRPPLGLLSEPWADKEVERLMACIDGVDLEDALG
jgi:N-acetylneuraminate lyase